MLIGIIILTYLLFRIPGLTALPVFCDEGIYIHWAQKMSEHFSAGAFLPLTDGKTPLFMWLMVPLLKIVSDPLFAGRFLSVLAGMASLLGAYYLGKKYFSLRTARIAALLFAAVPYVVFFDKMALADSMLAAFSLWSLVLALEVVRLPTWQNCILLGLILGGSVWVKTPGMLNFLTVPVALFVFELKKSGRKELLKRIGLLVSSEAVGYGIYNLLRLSPDFARLSSRDKDYYFPFSRLLTSPLDPLAGHIQIAADWFFLYLSWPVLFLVGVSIFLLIMKRNRVAFVFLLWSFLPMVPFLLLLKVFTARYILFTIYPLLLLAAWALVSLFELTPFRKNAVALVCITLVLLFPALTFDYYLTSDPVRTPLPRSERATYLEEWTAGYGLKETASYLTEEAKRGDILVLTDGYFGTLPDGLQVYLKDNPKISVWYIDMASLDTIIKSAGNKPKYLVAHKSHAVIGDKMTIIKEYPRATKPDGSSEALVLYSME